MTSRVLPTFKPSLKCAASPGYIKRRHCASPVETPVSIAFEGGRAFFRSYHKAWKTKRLRNNQHVEVAASTVRGKRTGPLIHARATLLQGEQARIAAKALARRHRLLQAILVPLAHRLMRYQTMHYELRPDPE